MSATGFQITRQDGVNPTNGAPTAYPSIYWGCHYATCTNGFSPVPVSSAQYASLRTSLRTTHTTSGQWNSSYDIWLDPTPRRDGQNTGAEVMVWLERSGSPQPIGSKVGTATLAGGTWDVWSGNIGWNVVSYVRTSGTTALDEPVRTFVDDAIARGKVSRSWYLTSVQAGFEPWSGSVGLGVNSFSVTSGSTPPPTSSPTPPPAGVACTARYRTTNSWQGGFTAEVLVRSTGTSPTRGWQVSWTRPSGQSTVNTWNAVPSSSGSTSTARSMSYNGAVAPGATTSFGYQGSGPAGASALSCRAS